MRNLSLFDTVDAEYEERATESERSRFTATCVLQYVRKHLPKVLFVENVCEFQHWGFEIPGTKRGDGSMYRWWRSEIEKLGYHVEEVFLESAFLGVASWRARMYVVAVRHGLPRPDLSYRPLADCDRCGRREASQTFRPKGPTWPSRRWGKYGRQWFYSCTSCHQPVVPDVVPALQVIDWNDLGTRIGERSNHGLRPLSGSTIERIRLGLQQASTIDPVWVGGGLAVVFANRGGPGHRPSARVHDGNRPLPTLVSSSVSNPALVTLDAELLASAEPFLAFQVKQNGAPGSTAAHPLTDPLGTITAHQDTTALVNAPSSAATEGSFDINLVRYRMLDPEELKLGMGFAPGFDLLTGALPQRARMRAVGNAVTPPASEFLARRVLQGVFT